MTVSAYLRDNNYSVTRARTTVYNALRRAGEPLTMSQLLAACSGVNRASVYRAVRLYESIGVLQRLWNGFKYQLELTDQFAPHHHHLVCERCQATIDVGNVKLEGAIATLSHEHGFNATRHHVEIYGLCHTCRGLDSVDDAARDTRSTADTGP